MYLAQTFNDNRSDFIGFLQCGTTHFLTSKYRLSVIDWRQRKNRKTRCHSRLPLHTVCMFPIRCRDGSCLLMFRPSSLWLPTPALLIELTGDKGPAWFVLQPPPYDWNRRPVIRQLVIDSDYGLGWKYMTLPCLRDVGGLGLYFSPTCSNVGALKAQRCHTVIRCTHFCLLRFRRGASPVFRCWLMTRALPRFITSWSIIDTATAISASCKGILVFVEFAQLPVPMRRDGILWA